MTEPDVRRVLCDSPVPSSSRDLAGPAWQRATRAGRRRRVLAVVSAVVVVAAVSGSLSQHRAIDSLDEPSTLARPTVSGVPTEQVGSALVWLMPSVSEEPGLPRTQSKLPAVVPAPAASAPKLSADPVGSFVAASAKKSGNGSVAYALGADGQWRTAASGLRPVRDPDGNVGSVVAWDAIAPDGRTLALTQPGAVVLVSESGTARRLSVGDANNETLAWVPSGLLRVRSAQGAWDLDPSSGAVTPVAVSSLDGEASLAMTGSRRPLLRQLIPDGSVRNVPVALPVFDWFGPTAVSPSRVASALGSTALGVPGAGLANPEAIAAVDRGTGVVAAVLVVGSVEGRSKVCCRVLRWLDDDTVAYVAGSRVLAWNVRTGAVSFVAQLPQGHYVGALVP